jgi:hypothetical protein
MIDIKPAYETNPEASLLLKASPELDKYVFEKILVGEFDFDGPLPSFSTRTDVSQILLVKLLSENGGVLVEASPGFYTEASAKRFVTPGRPTTIWKVTQGDTTAYGRMLSEAICKLSICRHFGIKK